ncbi:MAG: hypothetical protein HQK50_11320 [Oligoflexia bacterium]|nr:hypothetical protein [Oligoflexia bacterium]MBF0366154.1 hypothetical protein [Oligoflexia bacterium]
MKCLIIIFACIVGVLPMAEADVKVYADVKKQGISSIEMVLDGSNTIEFGISNGDEVELKGIKVDGCNDLPITVEQMKGTLSIHHKAPGQEGFSISYQLLIPRGSKLQITASIINFHGNIDVSKLWISSGMINMSGGGMVSEELSLSGGTCKLDVEIKGCKRLHIQCGIVSGEITIPESCSYRPLPSWNELKVNPSSSR